MQSTYLQRRSVLAALAALAAGGPPAAAGASGASAPSLHDYGPAPEFTGIAQWLNAAPLTLASLRGKVVLVDFWTYSCINCLRTLPHVNRWHERYAAQGLAVVGVHTPEFAFERSTRNVQTAMQRFGVRHPVAQDNSYATWKAYGNQYWPAHYLIDARGHIQYKHFGEGEYARTEAVIRTLLAARPGG
ncbi:MAG: thioredoxin family protein [Comamonadaceae bacterium]|nr:MAG: thioredoxin family protein [Comamonadaceae bacterium]